MKGAGLMKCDLCENCAGVCPTDPVASAGFSTRQEMGMSQAELAKTLGVAQPMVAQMESGKRKPSPRVAFRLARLSGKPIEIFVGEFYHERTG